MIKFKKILFLCCLSAVIDSEKINASWVQRVSASLNFVSGVLLMGFGTFNIVKNKRTSEIDEDINILALLYGGTLSLFGGIAIGDAWEQEKASAVDKREEDIEKKLIQILKKAAEKNRKIRN